MKKNNFLKTVIISSDDEGSRLDRVLRRFYPSLNQGFIEKNLRRKLILINKKKVKSSYRVKIGEELSFIDFKEAPININKNNEVIIDPKIKNILMNSVLYEDNDILVINKPPGLAVKGGTKVRTSLVDYLEFFSSGEKDNIKLVHRLDKDTSGVLILAKRTKVASDLGKIFQNREIKKYYWAFCTGEVDSTEGKIDLPLLKRKGITGGKEKIYVDTDGKKALTFYKILDSLSNKVFFLELNPVTGRTHQLRVHMSTIGMPIIGDGKYGGRAAFIDNFSNKLYLHSREIIIPSYNGREYRFIAPLRYHFKESFDNFGFTAENN